MKKSILVLVLFCFIVVSYSQHYTTWLNDTMINSSIQLFDRGKYVVILISTEYEDDMQQTIVSTGDYKQKKDTLFFTDYYLKYTLKFLKKGKQIISLNSFKWMKNMIFERVNEKDDQDIQDFANNPLTYFSGYSLENLKIHYPLYYSKYIFEDYSISLKKHNTYICKFGVITISEGYFNYNKKGLFFIDKNLGFSFKGIVNYNSLYLNFLPFNNVLLRVRKEVTTQLPSS